MKVNTPILTPTQIIAAVASVVAILVAATAIDDNTAQLVTGLAGVVVPAAFAIADSIRSHAKAQLVIAGSTFSTAKGLDDVDGAIIDEVII
jgi:hypothetical protein